MAQANSETYLNKAVYAYLSAPLFIFLISWLDYGFAALFGLLFAMAFYKSWQSMKPKEASWELSAKSLVAIIALAAVWCYFAGIGYFYYQSFDYHFRNAVFRDLINYSWPVMYDKADTPMVYYMAFWLPSAALAKLTSLIVSSPHANFIIANIYLYIYALIGVILLFAELSLALRAEKLKSVLPAVLAFMFFSGLDVVGTLFFATEKPAFDYHLDWWAIFMQYSSMTTGMFWVFNQFIPIALLTLLIYNERRIKTFGFLLALSLFFTPYPTAGVGIFMLSYATVSFIKSPDKKSFIINDIFSIENIIGVFMLLPVIVLYFITNSGGIDRLWYIFDYTTPKQLIIFLLLEFVLYAAVIFSQYKKDVFFLTLVVSLVLIPFLRLDRQNNFCMRASIPALVMLALYAIRFLKESKSITPKVLLSLMLMLGAATPLMEFYRGLHYAYQAHKIALTADEIKTLNRPYVRMPLFGWPANPQFTALYYRTDIFWRYFAKKHAP